MKKLAVALLALTSLPLHADIAQLRANLARYRATAPVAGTMEVHAKQQNSDDDDKQVTESTVSVNFEATPAGISVSLAQPLLEKARQEDRAARSNPELTKPTRSAISGIDLADLSEMLDAADSLERRLMGAKLLEEKPATVDGKPARVFIFQLDPALSKSDRKRVKNLEAKMNLWTTPEGVPLRADSSVKIKVSFLVVKFESTQSESAIFTTRDDRLIAIRHQEQSDGAGVGQKFSRNSVTTLRLR